MKLRSLIAEQTTTLPGTVKLYHFTREDMGDSVILNPKDSVNKRHYYSNNDYKFSKFPRVFYYTDLNKIEKQIKSPHLYYGKIDGKSILNLTSAVDLYQEDSDGLHAKNEFAWEVAHALMKKKDGVINWDAMFKTASKYFKGIYYDKGNLPIVNLFVPLEVRKDGKR